MGHHLPQRAADWMRSRGWLAKESPTGGLMRNDLLPSSEGLGVGSLAGLASKFRTWSTQYWRRLPTPQNRECPRDEEESNHLSTLLSTVCSIQLTC